MRLNIFIKSYRSDLKYFESNNLIVSSEEAKTMRDNLDDKKVRIIAVAKNELTNRKFYFLMDEEQKKVEIIAKEIKRCDGELSNDNWFLFTIVDINKQEYIVDAEFCNDFTFLD